MITNSAMNSESQITSDKQFMGFFGDFITDIPEMGSVKDTWSAIVSGMQVNYPNAYSYFVKNKQKLAPMAVNLLQKEYGYKALTISKLT